jgi:hypothetical protein
LVCIETCRACVAIMEYDSPLMKDMCGLCAKACDECAAACRKCGDTPCCQKCAAACEACQETCRAIAEK